MSAPARAIVPRITKELRRVPLSSIIGFRWGNPRKMHARMKTTLADSLTEFGEVETITARQLDDGRLEILNGHHRFEQLQALGQAEADVVVIKFPDDAKARIAVLALNRISADWDEDALHKFVDELLADTTVDAAYLQKTSGFTAADLEQLTAQNTDFLNDALRRSAAAPAPSGNVGGPPPPPIPAALPTGPGAPPTPTGGAAADALVAAPTSNFFASLTGPQNDALYAGIRACKRDGAKTTPEALAMMATAYVKEHP